MLFRDDLLLNEYNAFLSAHFNPIERNYNFLKAIQQIKANEQRQDIVPVSKLDEARLTVIAILEAKNRQLVADKKKNKTVLDL